MSVGDSGKFLIYEPMRKALKKFDAGVHNKICVAFAARLA